jgi:hypothetical protein
LRCIHFNLKTLLAIPVAAGLLLFWAIRASNEVVAVTYPPHREKQILEFIVVDGQTRTPVNGARVLVQQGANHEYVCPPTAVAGNTEGVVEVNCYWVFYTFSRSEAHLMQGEYVQVKASAEGYRETVLLFAMQPKSGKNDNRRRS